jgi:hypothetical protein
MITRQSASIGEMVNQSITVLTKPGVATFEQYEKRGNLTNALIYVAILAVISGALGLFTGGVRGFLGGFLSPFIGFLIFTGLVYYIGKQQGGTGTFDEVAYTFSLFWVPLSLIVAILSFLLVITIVGILLLPVLGILALIASVYFAYLAAQASLNLPAGGKVWVTLILAALGTWIAQLVIGLIFR